MKNISLRTETRPLVRLVDDDRTVLDALSLFLGMADLEVYCYGGAEEFLSKDNHEIPGCLVLDVRMPDMTGIELQAEMKHRGINLPVIFLSAHGDIEMAAEAVRNGAKNFLVKPPKPEKLLELVEEANRESLQKQRERAYGASLDAVWAELTPAEVQVAAMVAKGLQNAVIAGALEISERTVRAHREAVYRKLDAENAVEVADFMRELSAYGHHGPGGR